MTSSDGTDPVDWADKIDGFGDFNDSLWLIGYWN